MPRLARPASLPRRADFLRAAREGMRVSSHGMVVQLVDRGDDAPARVGITATKKLGNAVVRNRVRRRLREAARLELGARAMPGLDLVLIGRDGTRAREFAELCAELRRALDKRMKPR
jgi:ribonuclease P protein component